MAQPLKQPKSQMKDEDLQPRGRDRESQISPPRTSVISDNNNNNYCTYFYISTEWVIHYEWL